MIAFTYDNEAQRTDLLRPNGRNVLYSVAYDLQTAVTISLFTDRRAAADDDVPPNADKRGYWGDSFPRKPGDLIGSRLWLLRRNGKDAVRRTKLYAEEALAWMIEDGVAESVTATPTKLSPGILLLDVVIIRPGELGRWQQQWEILYAV